MKPNCVILSDVALRQKALDVLSSYTPAWLRLGLVIVLGTIALTEQEGEKRTDAAFLRVLVEEHFFFDSTLAKQFSTNRSVPAQSLRGTFLGTCKYGKREEIEDHYLHLLSFEFRIC